MSDAVRVEGLCKDYHLKSGVVRTLREVDLTIPHGDLLAIMGTSGSGKSTLLNLLGCLDHPTAGRVLLGDEDVSRCSDDRLSEIRAARIGFIFQSFNLIAQLTVLENIQVPLYYQGRLTRESDNRCRELADMVGLGDRLHHRPAQLSGGQQQRVAVARSLANDPQLILADEPTGNLDSSTTEDLLGLIERLNREGKTILIVTHESEVAKRARRIVRLKDGMVESDELREGRTK